MSKTDQHPSGTSLNASTRKWADEVVAIEANPKQGGLEIRFNAEPSPQLRPKLRVKGFRHSTSKTMWYGDQTAQALEFARQVKDSLPTSPEGPDLFISPSLDAVRSNIEKKEFSFVLITLKSGQVKNFIVFEPSKPRAEVIALNFARQEFKDDFLAFAVKPQMHIREARILFDEGKIIGAGEDVPGQMNVHKESKTSQPETVKQPGKIPVKEILLTTTENDGQPLYKEGKAFSAWSGADLFVKGLAGKFPKVYYRIIWQNGEAAEGKVDLEPVDFYKNTEEILSGHVQSYFFNLSMAKPNALNSKEAIKKAAKILEGYELKHIPAITQPTPEKKTEKIDSFAPVKDFHEPKDDSQPQKAIAENLKSGDTFLPNVLVPVNVKEPFLSQNFSIHDMPAIIKENFPHLLKINEENLSKASALEMFELVQMAHPTEYGIDVGRSGMLSEWEKRGKEMFEQLGYPTDVIYPYVNLYLGYESIQALGEILSDNNKEGNEWWVVAEHYRPIADPKKGLEIINQLIEKQKRERQTLINPKTGKPKLEFKHLHRDIELTIENLEDSKGILNFYLEHSAEKSDSTVETEVDPLTNENGVFTEKTAGGNLLEIEIPMPQAAQYRANISIAKTSKGDYRYGLRAEKQFGDREGMSYAPNIAGQPYPSERQALENGLKEHEQRLELLLKAKDTLLNNQGKKSTMLSAALSALKKFAEGEGIFLENIEPVKKNIQFLHVSPERAKLLEEKKSDDEKTNSNAGIIKGLEQAYWTEADNEYPVNKAIVKGYKFNQARLREAIRDKLVKLPLTTLQNIADELSTKFKQRRPWNTYEKGYVTIGKKGDKRKAAAIVIYIDDLIIDNDLMGETDSPVMTFLMELLFAGDKRLVDFPITKNMEENKKGSLIKTTKDENKKRSLTVTQYELNKEIEAFIDKRDKEKATFDEEEKNHISQYTGSGGLIKEGAQGRGVLYEYYTPDEVVKKMWGLARKYGYSGGRILEPSVGTGTFLKYAPKEADVFGFETNHYSARIAQVLYPQARIFEKSFETIFFAGNIHLKNDFDHAPYDLVIGNPPYGDFTGKYAGMGEKQWTGATEYDQYFITRGLDLLSPGGLLVFIVPSSFLSYSEKSKKVKQKIAEKAELLDAYRLPIRTFETTDIGTDIVVFKKK